MFSALLVCFSSMQNTLLYYLHLQCREYVCLLFPPNKLSGTLTVLQRDDSKICSHFLRVHPGVSKTSSSLHFSIFHFIIILLKSSSPKKKSALLIVTLTFSVQNNVHAEFDTRRLFITFSRRRRKSLWVWVCTCKQDFLIVKLSE